MYYNQLYHHGILGMHWGIRRYQPYPKGHKGGKEIGKAARKQARKERKGARINRRAEKKLSKYESKIQSQQKEANKHYQKAMKKTTSFFGSQKRVDKEMGRANDAQRVVNKLEFKGQKYYARKSKKLAKMGIDENPRVKQLGQKYIDSVNATSKTMYLTNMTGGSMKRRR